MKPLFRKLIQDEIFYKTQYFLLHKCWWIILSPTLLVSAFSVLLSLKEALTNNFRTTMYSNVEECTFDGGDCCLDHIDDQFCEECWCFETDTRHSPLVPTSLGTTYGWSTEPTSCLPHLVNYTGMAICFHPMKTVGIQCPAKT